KALQLSVPRPGVAARLEIGLVGAGDIEGLLVKDDGSGLEGVDIERLDAAGRGIATTRSDFDGLFLFARVAYGRYHFRIKADSASAVGIEQAIARTAEITPERAMVRLGTIRARKIAKI